MNQNGYIQTWVTKTCHGCTGKGWVETSDRQPHKCVVCTGSGIYTGPDNNPFYPSPLYPQPIYTTPVPTIQPMNPPWYVGDPIPPNFIIKIGRASCRERVCQYV